MNSGRPKTSPTFSARERVAGGFAVLLVLLAGLAGVTTQLMKPVQEGAGRVQESSARAEHTTEVALMVGDAHARMAQYALSATVADQKAAEESLARLDEVIANAKREWRDESGLATLTSSYRSSVEHTFAAVVSRRSTVERFRAASTEIAVITSAVALAMDREIDSELIRRGVGLALSFRDADVAATRLLASRSPADARIAVGALARVPNAIAELSQLASGKKRIERFVAALTAPLAAYSDALRGIVDADGELRRLAAERNAARAAVFAASAAERATAMGLKREAIASMLSEASSVRSSLFVVSVAAFAIGLVLALLIGRALVAQIRELEDVQSALHKKSSLLETTLAHMDQGLIMVTAERTIGVINARARELISASAAAMQEGASFDDLRASVNKQGAQLPLDAGQRRRQGDLTEQPLTYEWRVPKGTVLEIRSVPLRGGGSVQTYTDITERTLAAERIQHAAHHDVLTNLPNRAKFSQQIDEAIADADATGVGFAVMFLDLDRFKLVNDTLGHLAGDDLLLQVADRMQQVIRPTDTLARIGGDEFALVMPKVPNPEVAIVTAERIQRVVRKRYLLPRGAANIGVSIGVCCYPQHGSSAEQLLGVADLALYRAKAGGRDMCCVFDEALDAEIKDDLILEREMQLALQDNQFELFYQPIWDTRAQTVVGAEALARWRHPTRGMIAPDIFIPLAEETGFIIELGRWALETACREAFSWVDPISISVNVSPAQLHRKELVREVRDLLMTVGLSPSRLKLEITEGQLLEETAEMIATLTALRGLGVKLALDDFGTAHSSLSTMVSFPFTDIKIDRRFINGIAQDERSRSLFEAICRSAAS